MLDLLHFFCFFFFNDTATTEIYTLSLHDALPISSRRSSLAWISRPTRSWKTSTGRMSCAFVRRTRDEGAMVITLRQIKYAVIGFGVLVAAAVPAAALAADPDWKAVEQALGKSGQMQPGDVFRIGMPRTDLNVTVKGISVKAGFALGSYAAFKQVGDHAMVMGDLVLLDQEVPAAMSGLFSGGLEVTAVHDHIHLMSSHHIDQHNIRTGDAVLIVHAL